jgi:hypothetical protein
MTNSAPKLEAPLHESLPAVEITGSLGIAQELLATQGDVRPFKTWMGISTNPKVYSDDMVLGFARWTEAHSTSFTLVVSDWLNGYNWVAEHGDWDRFHKGAHIESTERAVLKRMATLQERFKEQGIGAQVVSWSQLVLDDIPPEVGSTYGYEFQLLHHATEYPREGNQFGADLLAVVHTQAHRVRQRSLEKGHSEAFVDAAMTGYALEEVWLSILMAETGRANVKIGPPVERSYDEMTAKYIHPGGYSDEGAYPDVPFGAVYLAEK